MAGTRRRLSRLGTWAMVLAALTPAPTVSSQEQALALEDVALLLGSSDPMEVQRAIEAAAVVGDPQAAGLLEQRVREGLPPDLLASALDTLGLLSDPATAGLLRDLTLHRRAEVRVRALEILASLGVGGADGAEVVLTRALGDGDAQVRSAAATALGALKVQSALSALFGAYERGVDGSGTALAQLANADQLERIVAYLGVYPFQNAAPILVGLLERSDWKDQDKLRVVAQLQAVATAEARTLLQSVADMDPKHVSARVRRAALDAALRISN